VQLHEGNLLRSDAKLCFRVGMHHSVGLDGEGHLESNLERDGANRKVDDGAGGDERIGLVYRSAP
jgi:hypothetical protein